MTKKRLVLTLVAIVVLAAFVGWYYLFREVRPRYASEFEHFQYGSVGVEAASGVPYWIWYVLPRVCADRPPGREGYAPYGFTWEDGRRAPMGLPVMTVGFDRVGVNCALCHVGSMRLEPNGARRLLPGAPTSRVDLQGYLRFLFACADSPRFTADAILTEIRKVHSLPAVESLLYRRLVIPRMKRALQAQKAQLSWMDRNPEWGPGRSDPFNPAKAQLLGLPPDGTIGNADPEPLWNFEQRRGYGMHWDGLNDSLHEIVLNSGIGNGANGKSADLESLHRIERWVTTLKPPPWPYSIDRSLAAQGDSIYKAECASCHAFGGSRTGQAIPIAELGTDRHRLASWSPQTAERFNALAGYKWRYSQFRATFGYMAVPLDGIWSRAPYLHNGAVPSLADLLEPPEARPKTFYRGYDVYDQQRVGFVFAGPEAEAEGWKLDTSLPGNSNGGHLWGTALPPAQKQALIEYLKTL